VTEIKTSQQERRIAVTLNVDYRALLYRVILHHLACKTTVAHRFLPRLAEQSEALFQ